MAKRKDPSPMEVELQAAVKPKQKTIRKLKREVVEAKSPVQVPAQVDVSVEMREAAKAFHNANNGLAVPMLLTHNHSEPLTALQSATLYAHSEGYDPEARIVPADKDVCIAKLEHIHDVLKQMDFECVFVFAATPLPKGILTYKHEKYGTYTFLFTNNKPELATWQRPDESAVVISVSPVTLILPHIRKTVQFDAYAG